MLEYGGICSLLAGKIACKLGKVLLVRHLLLVLGEILTRTELAPKWFLSEPTDDVSELLRMFMQYWLLSN